MTTRNTPHCLKLVAAVLLLGAPLKSQASLVITDSDINANHYLYDLTFNEMANSTVFNADVFSQTRMEVVQEGDGSPNYLSPDRFDNSGYTTAEFTYKFDFSTTSYRPTSLDVYDNLTAAWPDGGPHETLTSAYSLDGVNFTTIRTVTTVGATSFQYINSQGSNTIDLSTSTPSVLYYKVTFVANDSTFGFGWNAAQWNRTLSDGTPFSTDFTVAAVPEPSAGALLIGGGLALLVRLAKRHRR